MKRRFEGTLICFLLLILGAINAIAQEKIIDIQTSTEREKIEAEQLWEKMIEVKGGREKLHSINNLMWSIGEKPEDTAIYLEVYPNKHWDWVRLKSFHNTMWVRMSNMENCEWFIAGYTSFNSEKVSEEECQLNRLKNLQEASIFLLETKWLQPKPIRVTRHKINREEFDVVETLIPANNEGLFERMDFYIDPKSLLVQRVLEYYKGKPSGFNLFKDYVSVDGIKMPVYSASYLYRHWNEKIRLKSSTKMKWNFNVEYNEQIFEKPPSVKAGADAWKPTQ